MKRYTLLLYLCGLPIAHAASSDELDQLLSMSLAELLATKVSISTSTLQTLSGAPSVISIITAEDIQATGATNLTEILQSIPGVYIQTNLFGARPRVTFRGAAATHTLLMVDGDPIKDLVWNAGIYWRGLPTTMIDRVEIIRGPGSALFGSDASAGVINVITKTASKIEASEAGIRAGSYDMREAWVQHGATWNGYDTAFSAELSHSNGYDPFIASDASHAHYGYDNEDLRFSVARAEWRLNAAFNGHDNVATGLTGAGVLDPVTRGSDHHYNLDLLYSEPDFSRDWGLDAQLRYMDLDYSSGGGFREALPNGAYPDGMLDLQRAAERRLSFESSGLYRGFRQHAIRLGAGYVFDDLYRVEQLVNYDPATNLPSPWLNLAGTPHAFAPENNRQINYLFLQDIWTFNRDWELTAGARYDHYSDFGSTVNPRLALVWRTTPRLDSKLLYGKAFRAPSYQELFSLTSATLPNANLKPEHSDTWDLAFSYLATPNWTLGLDLYRFAQTDLITAPLILPTPAAAPYYKFQNLGSNISRGVEFESKWQATKALRISGNLSNREDSVPYNVVPKTSAYLRADWGFMPKWNWDLQSNWIGKHDLAPTDTRTAIAAYTLVDTTLHYAPRKDRQLAASIRNLFDVDARELSSRSIPGNLPLPGRHFDVELRQKF